MNNSNVDFNHDLVPSNLTQAQNSGKDIKINILSPRDNSRVTRLPDVPGTANSLAFHVELSQAVDQVLWYVDNQPYKTVEFPYTLRWVLEPGEHRFQAELPYYGVISKIVKITVD